MIAPKLAPNILEVKKAELASLHSITVGDITREYQYLELGNKISGPAEPVFLEYLGLTPTKPVVIPKRKYTKKRRALRNDNATKI